jgi:hypothetical protein
MFILQILLTTEQRGQFVFGAMMLTSTRFHHTLTSIASSSHLTQPLVGLAMLALQCVDTLDYDVAFGAPLLNNRQRCCNLLRQIAQLTFTA